MANDSKVTRLDSARRKKLKKASASNEELTSKDTNASLRVSGTLRNQLKGYAALSGRNLYDLTNEALTEYLRKAPKISV